MTAGKTHIRVLATGIGSRGALLVALPLTDIDHTLHNQLLLLILIGAGGIALAALLGLLVARTALQPIARFTRRTEAIASAPDRLGQRVEVSGDDELARLARTFNATLDELERSVDAQRNLVADASHELRTPIASLRANLQLLRDESRLSQADRDALREDMIEELDELTGLVGDVVEMARGTKRRGEAGDVRLDQIVSREVEHTRRRAPELTVNATIEPTLVHGEADRIARAVANLLDNARNGARPQASWTSRSSTACSACATTVRGSPSRISRSCSTASTGRAPPDRSRGRAWGWRSSARRPRPTTASPKRRTRPAGARSYACRFGQPLELPDELIAARN